MAWPCACPPNICDDSTDETFHTAYSREGNSYYPATPDKSQYEERGRQFAASSFVTPDRPPPPFVIPESTIVHADIGDLSGSMAGSWPSCCMDDSSGTDASFNRKYDSVQPESPGADVWFNPIYESPPEHSPGADVWFNPIYQSPPKESPGADVWFNPIYESPPVDSPGADVWFNPIYESPQEEPSAYRPYLYGAQGTPAARPRCAQMARRRFDTISEQMSPPAHSTPTGYRYPPSPPTPDFPERPPAVSPSIFHGDGTPVALQPCGGLNFSPPRPRRRLDFSSSEVRCPTDYTTPAGNRSFPTPASIYPDRQPVESPSRFQGDGSQGALQSCGGLNLSPPRPRRRLDFSSSSYGDAEDVSGDILIDINIIPD